MKELNSTRRWWEAFGTVPIEAACDVIRREDNLALDQHQELRRWDRCQLPGQIKPPSKCEAIPQRLQLIQPLG
jgi:hypothetical protein